MLVRVRVDLFYFYLHSYKLSMDESTSYRDRGDDRLVYQCCVQSTMYNIFVREDYYPSVINHEVRTDLFWVILSVQCSSRRSGTDVGDLQNDGGDNERSCSLERSLSLSYSIPRAVVHGPWTTARGIE